MHTLLWKETIYNTKRNEHYLLEIDHVLEMELCHLKTINTLLHLKIAVTKGNQLQ